MIQFYSFVPLYLIDRVDVKIFVQQILQIHLAVSRLVCYDTFSIKLSMVPIWNLGIDRRILPFLRCVGTLYVL